MNLSPLHTLENPGLLFGGQASDWKTNLAAFNTDPFMNEQLITLLEKAQHKTAPCARELAQIVPGAHARLLEIIAGDTSVHALDGEPAVSVAGIVLGQIAAVAQLKQLGLGKFVGYGHSQGILGVFAARHVDERPWADNEVLVDCVAFALLLGAGTSQARFGRMVAVKGVPVELLPGVPAVTNGPRRAVYSGTAVELAKVRRVVQESVDKHNAAIDQHVRGGEHVDVDFIDLGVDAAFHHEGNRDAVAKIVQWSADCGVQLDAAGFAEDILITPFVWEVGEHDYFLSLDSALGAMTAELSDAVIIDASSPALRDDLATPGTQLPQVVDYSAFAPKVVRLPHGEVKVETTFSRLTGLSPIILAGMTPTTVDADIVAAAANAGHWAELAGGGQYSEEVFNRNNGNLQAQLAPGRSAQFNSMFFDRYMWNLQFGQQRIVSKARAAGAAINGVTISAGIPELEEASQLIADLHTDGFPFIAFKPGTVAQIESVLAIADAHPETDIVIQIEDGHAGGHHSWVDLDDLLLATYKKLRARDNVVVVVGGGIGTPEKAAKYLSGEWAKAHGRRVMPLDGILVGTAAMAAKEAKTSDQVKQALVDTPGIPEGWVGRLKSKGGMTSGQSHLLADLYEIDNDFARASRLITSLDPDTYADHADEIIEAINKTAKPYFGNLEDMTYAQWVERFVELAYPFTDPTWDDRFFDLLHRVEARLNEADHGEIPTLFATIEQIADAPAAVDTLLAAYPQAREILVRPVDAAWFIALNRKHHKPMPWVPIIDGDLKRWFGLDSLWQAHDSRYPAHAVRVIPGPISVAGITEANEPVASILGRFEQACVDHVRNAGGQEEHKFSRLGATAYDAVRNARTISWHGHLIDNPAHFLNEDAFELIEEDAHNYTLRILADTTFEHLPKENRPYLVESVDIPLELGPDFATGASPVVSHSRLPDAVFALLAGVAGVGSTSAAGDTITALPRVDSDGYVHDSFHLPAQLPRTHAGVSSGNPEEITPDVLVGPCWPAIYTALGTGKLHDGYPVIEGLLNAVHLDHLVNLHVPLKELANGREITVTSYCESIAESASGRIVTVTLKLYSGTTLVGTMMERFAIRGRQQGTNTPVAAPNYGAAQVDITSTPRSFIDRATYHAPADMTPFAMVTGDYNPIHTSYNAANLVGLPAPLVHGMWLSATAQQVAGRHGTVTSWTYSMYGMVQLNDEVEITVERVGRAGTRLALEVTCRIRGEVVSRGQALLAQPRIAYIYPGQGIQAKGMGRSDRDASPAARAVWERADAHTRAHLGFSIVEVIDDNPTELTVGTTTFRHPKGVLNLTQFTQVALAVVAFGQTERLRDANVLSTNSYYAGHSLGEYTALASLGNIFDLEAVIDIVYSRGSAMHSLVPRDEHGQSNYALGALRPNRIGLAAEDVENFVAKVAEKSGEYLEIVNYNIAGQQYAVAGTRAGLAALEQATGHPKAFVLIPGIDVPFHSAVLRPGVAAFAEKLDELLPETIDVDALVGRYIPNLVARPFELSDDFVDAILEVVPSERLEELKAQGGVAKVAENALARLLLIELLSWQFASPVRWIETQELLIAQVDEIIEVGLAASPTLTNLALASMKIIGLDVPVRNVERDLDQVMYNDAVTAQEPEVEAQPAEAETAQLAPAEPAPAPEPAPQPVAEPAPAQASGSGPVTDLPFSAADAIDVLFAFQNKVRVDQIVGTDTTEILTGGVSSRRNQLLMDMSAELGVAAIDGAADAEITVLHQRVLVAAPTYQAFGPVLGDAITAHLRHLFGAAGIKPAQIAERASKVWNLPASWVPHIEAELLLGTREGESVRGGALGSLPQKANNKAEAEALIDAAITNVAAQHNVAVAIGGSSSGGGATVDSAALDEFADKILGYDGILARNARRILHELGHLDELEEVERSDDDVYAALDAELGAGWLKDVQPVFDERRAVLFDDRWALAREELAQIALGYVEGQPHRFAGVGEVVANQARYWATQHPDQAAVLEAIAQAARGESLEPYRNDIAIVTGASPDSIAQAVVEKLLAGGATVIMTASRVDQKRKEFARRLYSENASAHAALWLVPANLSSYRDTDALVNWAATEQKASVGGVTEVTKPALVPTLLFPFAAPKVHGLLTDAGPVAENQARLLLWSVERLIAKAAEVQSTGRVHVVLPGSPNRGTFGGDGAYGEVKAALDAVVNKWHAESGWPAKVSLAHAHIGWVAGTNLMSGNDALIPLAQAEGIKIYRPAEIAAELLGLVSADAREKAQREPLIADFTGGLRETNISLPELASRLERDVEVEEPETPAQIKALPTPVWHEQAAAIETAEITQSLDDMVVIVGIGEVSSWGSGRTRHEAEMGINRDGSVDLTAAGVLELAWMTGLVTWKEDPAPGWYDENDQAVAEEDIYERFRDEVVARAGIRQLTDKYFLTGQGSIDVATVFLDRDIEFVVDSEEDARAYLDADENGTTIGVNADGEWVVRKAKGAIARVPKKATLSRTVAGQMPDGFDPAKWGIPASMLDGLDRIAVWNLVTAVDAFLTAGFSPAELLQAVHPGDVSNTQATGIGGMESLHKVFVTRFLGEARPSDILQEALPNVVAAHVMQSYIGGYGQMIHPVAACATAAVSVEEAVDKIRLGKSDVVVAGGIDDVQVESLAGFGDMNATAETAAMLAKGIDSRFISRANDRRRGGFLEAEGGGTVIVARGRVAKELGLPVYAVIAHAQSYADGAHTSIPAPGLGALGAGRGGTESRLAKSLQSLGLSPDDVAVVSKHDTSTNANDPNESQLHSLLWPHVGRDQSKPLFVISQKTLTGHAKGGAALFQMGGLIDAFTTGMLPPNAALDCVDKAIEPKATSLVWLRNPLNVGLIKAGVLTSLGFGHVAAVVVLAHPGIFAKVAGEQWRKRATQRLRNGQHALEKGMIGRGELYVQPQDRRLPKSGADAAEINMLLDPEVRLGADGVYPTSE
ncbi:MAG: DUF1729 domain-containing protein [Corynebacterium sp.]|uniref:type I polyketide synthase n=1 Tax=Corynebacterium sp. TaxID=1720 RepID=UPI0026DA8F4B|nr:type I polyketide synthase [Corynebacterium sp.]MDO4761514.1 DUF1729 domain-containing protein [Corynebacterium sp.]